jgi:hypothetical protein
VANATELRQFGLQLHQLWGLLCRQVRLVGALPAVFPWRYGWYILAHTAGCHPVWTFRGSLVGWHIGQWVRGPGLA